jgi:hypothetical protein
MEVFIPIVFFIFLGAVILVPIWLRERTRLSGHRLVQQALERGQALDPGLVRELTGNQPRQPPPDRARRTLGWGIVLLALGGGLGAAGFMGEVDGMYVPAIILGALGFGFALLSVIDYNSKKKEG